jgi:hypothetical protein
MRVKRLRIAIPWDEAEDVPDGGEDEPIIKAQCLDWASCAISSCADDFTTYIVVQGVSAAFLEGPLNPEYLEAARQQLEARLARVTEAQQKLNEADPA